MSNSPIDDLPKQYDHRAAQQRWHPYWERQGYFHAEPDAKRPPYSIVIPPPNVTGALHLGHALNNTLQDILIRWRRMQGYNTLWMPGTDHAGIATQAVVERRLLEEENLTRHDLGREKLVERIWQWKDQYEARILSQLKQLGCSCDWQRTRFTLDDVCARAVRETFFRLFKEGLIYRGKKLVNWDTYLQTAVSDDEVFHETVKGHFWHFRYPVIDPQPGEPESVTIATTRPETMLGDTAVAVHPDPGAALSKLENDLAERLATAPTKERPEIEQQLEAVRQRRERRLTELETLRDMALDGRMVMLPLLERPIPLIDDTWAKPELGSGCVKITPAHDPNDYDVWQRNPHIGAINILNPDGTLNENAGPYRGLPIKEARRRVVTDLESQGLLGETEDREIDLAHSDRSKTPIEPYLADQWFVRMDHLAQLAMDAVTGGRVRIVPERYAKGYLDWLAEKRDWPVGRQLWWGHRIPIWSKSGPDAHEHAPHLQAQIDDWTNEDRVSADTRRSEAADGDEEAQLTYFVCVRNEDDRDVIEALEAAGYTQEEEVLDTWFSSALWPHSTLGWPEKTPELDYFYPTSTLVTSRDIITLWVARMVLTGLFNMNDVPFREVFIHPKILDGYGETMSKSKGNGVDPLDVIEKFGADSLRFGIAHMTTETQDARMPVEFECPHCGGLIEQTKKNRILPRVTCSHCNKPFATQWADKPEDRQLPRASAVSERFELGRNFCNKMWNASRFAVMNLAGFEAGGVSDDELAVEDRWLLSRLATVTQTVTEALEGYRFADAARTLYDFAWDEFCSFYVEMAKARLDAEATRATARRVLAAALDALLRLLHPMIPFLTEEVWQLLAQTAPQRGLGEPQQAAESIMIAPWPQADLARRDEQIERQFAQFQTVLGALREIRASQNIPPRETIEFAVRCDEATARLLGPMEPYFTSMAGARPLAMGAEVQAPETSADRSLAGMDIYVDTREFIDVAAEIERSEKERGKVLGWISGSEKKLANENFVNRAKPEVVQRERDRLAQLQQDLASLEATLEKLRALP